MNYETGYIIGVPVEPAQMDRTEAYFRGTGMTLEEVNDQITSDPFTAADIELTFREDTQEEIQKAYRRGDEIEIPPGFEVILDTVDLDKPTLEPNQTQYTADPTAAIDQMYSILAQNTARLSGRAQRALWGLPTSNLSQTG